MSQESQNKSSESRGNSPLVILMLFAIAALVIVAVFTYFNRQQELTYGDFKRLLENTQYEKDNPDRLSDGYSGKIIIRDKDKPKFEISRLRDVTVFDNKVTGTINRLDISNANRSGDEEGEPRAEPEQIDFVTSKSESSEITSQLQNELSRRNVNFRSSPKSFWDQYGFYLLILGAAIIVFIFMMRRLGGAGGPMQFGRSRGRLYAEEDLSIRFEDAAGIDEAVEEVREVVDFLKSPEKYQKLGGRIPKGVLLVGPPGTGKTLLAKAIAGEAQVPFFSLSGSDFVEMFVGVGAARVRDMFQQAQQKAPSIIFIDELDALGKSRGGNVAGSHEEREQTLNALLVEMDGFDANVGVIVMGATNRPETLDPALLRPGRFDRNVLVDRPDLLGREAILKVHVKNVKLNKDVNLKQIASITSGFVGADLANLVNEAALLAARKERTSVGFQEFNEAVERVTAGLEKKQRVMNEDEKQRIAYHESGHAIVAYSLPNTDPVHKVSIIPRGIAALGYVMQRPDGDRYLKSKSELLSQIMVLMAGTIAEENIYQDISTGAQNDLQRATDIAYRMVTEFGMSKLGRVYYSTTHRSVFLDGPGEEGARRYSEQTAVDIDSEVKRIINESITEVRRILEVRHKALLALTKRLIETESIDAVELKEIIDEHSPGPILVPGTADTPTKPKAKVDNEEPVEKVHAPQKAE
jgi:cell division protease FtsH